MIISISSNHIKNSLTNFGKKCIQATKSFTQLFTTAVWKGYEWYFVPGPQPIRTNTSTSMDKMLDNEQKINSLQKRLVSSNKRHVNF